ncbi:MAG TPA: hypothetical protein ENK20_08710 [Chromatiales bacterium]|nr:hypothetical protein [Chromatiales bacterium]
MAGARPAEAAVRLWAGAAGPPAEALAAALALARARDGGLEVLLAREPALARAAGLAPVRQVSLLTGALRPFGPCEMEAGLEAAAARVRARLAGAAGLARWRVEVGALEGGRAALAWLEGAEIAVVAPEAWLRAAPARLPVALAAGAAEAARRAAEVVAAAAGREVRELAAAAGSGAGPRAAWVVTTWALLGTAAPAAPARRATGLVVVRGGG